MVAIDESILKELLHGAKGDILPLDAFADLLRSIYGFAEKTEIQIRPDVVAYLINQYFEMLNASQEFTEPGTTIYTSEDPQMSEQLLLLKKMLENPDIYTVPSVGITGNTVVMIFPGSAEYVVLVDTLKRVEIP